MDQRRLVTAIPGTILRRRDDRDRAIGFETEVEPAQWIGEHRRAPIFLVRQAISALRLRPVAGVGDGRLDALLQRFGLRAVQRPVPPRQHRHQQSEERSVGDGWYGTEWIWVVACSFKKK